LSKLLKDHGVMIIGISSIEGQRYVSRHNKNGHVNCKSGDTFKKFVMSFFYNVYLFSVNEIHTFMLALWFFNFIIYILYNKMTLYFDFNWAKIVAKFDNGVPCYFEYKAGNERFYYQYIKRDIANELIFLEKNRYFDIITPFDYGGFYPPCKSWARDCCRSQITSSPYFTHIHDNSFGIVYNHVFCKWPSINCSTDGRLSWFWCSLGYSPKPFLHSSFVSIIFLCSISLLWIPLIS